MLIGILVMFVGVFPTLSYRRQTTLFLSNMLLFIALGELTLVLIKRWATSSKVMHSDKKRETITNIDFLCDIFYVHIPFLNFHMVFELIEYYNTRTFTTILERVACQFLNWDKPIIAYVHY